MSAEKLVLAIGEHLSRQKLMVRLGGGAILALAGLMALPIVAQAQNWECCDLCFSPPGFCTGYEQRLDMEVLRVSLQYK
jgi:hypothetical protein